MRRLRTLVCGARRARGAGSWRHELALRGIGWMRLSALRSLFDCWGRVYFCAWSWAELGQDMSRERFLISSLADLIRQSMRTPACLIGHFGTLHVSMDTGSGPVLTKKGERPRRPQAAKGEKGIGAQNRRSSRRPSGDSPWQNPGANASREQPRPGAPIAAMQSREQRSRIRPSNKCPASGICMTWGRRQTQNVHRPCLRVYTRTAISRMRRSARVQRGRAIFCSIAAGANYRSVACARSAH